MKDFIVLQVLQMRDRMGCWKIIWENLWTDWLFGGHTSSRPEDIPLVLLSMRPTLNRRTGLSPQNINGKTDEGTLITSINDKGDEYSTNGWGIMYILCCTDTYWEHFIFGEEHVARSNNQGLLQLWPRRYCAHGSAQKEFCIEDIRRDQLTFVSIMLRSFNNWWLVSFI